MRGCPRAFSTQKLDESALIVAPISVSEEARADGGYDRWTCGALLGHCKVSFELENSSFEESVREVGMSVFVQCG